MGDYANDAMERDLEIHTDFLHGEGHYYHDEQLQQEHDKVIQKQSNPKKMNSNVQSVTGAGTWENPNGVDLGNSKTGFYTYEYTFEDGVILKANHKTATPPYPVGTPVDYTVKGENNYGKYGSVGKPKEESPDPNPETYHPNKNKPNYGYKETEADYKRKQILIVLQSSLKEALQFHAVAGYEGHEKVAQKEEAYQTAEYFAHKILTSELIK